MSLILTVEPDAQRAAQLQVMARTYLDAQFVLAPSVAQGFHALGDRIPDLLLTPPLLPPSEEAALDDYLRLLGPTGAHVQLLTIPLLSSSGGADRDVLSGRRRDRSRGAKAEGCEPVRFAEQIAHYLREIRNRPRGEPGADDEAEPEDLVDLSPLLDDSAVDPSLVALEQADVVEDPYALSVLDALSSEDAFAVAPEVVELGDLIDPEPELEPLPVPEPHAAMERTVSAEPVEALEPVLLEPAVPLASLPFEPVALEPVALERVALEPVASLVRQPRPAPPLARPGTLVRAANPAAIFADQPNAPMAAAPAALPAPPVPSVQVISVPTGDGTTVQAAVNVSVAVSVQVAAAVNVSAPAAPKKGKPRPTQDEWGLFDPGQCGFQALMARLDEIAAKEDDEA